jgi:hypothetical protein
MLMQLQQPAIGSGNTDSNALQLVNLSLAAHNAPQNSPPLALQGAGWNQNNSTSETIEFLAYVSSQEVSSAPATGQLIFASSRNGNTPQLQLILTDAGQLQFQAAASQIVPGATSLSIRNHASTADNILVNDNGAVVLGGSAASLGSPSAQNLVLLPGGGDYVGRLGINTTSPSSLVEIRNDGINFTQSDTNGLSLVNTSAAYSGSPRFSPPLRWHGNVWNGSASLPIDFRAYVVPVNSTVSAYLRFESQINGAGYGGGLNLTTDGFLGIGTATPQSILHLGGGITLQAVFTATSYTMTRADCIVNATTITGALTVTLPAASTSFGFLVHVKKTDAFAHSVTVQAAGSDKIEGAASLPLSGQYNSVTLYSDGATNWYKIATT